MTETATTKTPMSSPPSVNVARLTYLLVCEAGGVAIALSTAGSSIEISIGQGLLFGLGVAGLFIWIESLMKGFTLRGFSTASFGLGVGLFCGWLLTRVEISNLLAFAYRDLLGAQEIDALRLAFDVALYSSLGFLGAVLALRSNRDEFAFIIPYVRFRQDAATGQPIVLDGEAVMDGRVPGILNAGFLHGRLIVPRFVLQNLQLAADTPNGGNRLRAQRGLDCLEQMQKSPTIQISIQDSRGPVENETLANRLIEISRLFNARLMTVDENLAKVAKLQGIDVLNIHDLDEALKPSVTIGEKVKIALVRGGKEDHQAVGYLPDGTMIVVNHAVEKIGSSVEVSLVSTFQTNAGTMVFAELS